LQRHGGRHFYVCKERLSIAHKDQMKKEKPFSSNKADIFSRRELDVMAYLVNGHSCKAAALFLKMSSRTVDTHLRNIYTKTGTTSKEQLIMFLDKNRILDQIRDRFPITKTAGIDEAETVEVAKTAIFRRSESFFTNRAKQVSIGAIILLTGIISYEIRQSFSNKKSSIKIIMEGLSLSDNYYIDRKKITDEMDRTLSCKKSLNIVTLMGHGGSGKSTIAKKYLQDGRYDFAYEINAETLVSTEVSVQGLAYSLADTEEQKNNLRYILSITGAKEKEKQILLFIKSELAKKNNWCLLFDNVEDFETLKRFCPYGSDLCGNIIITTRNGEIQNINYLGRVYYIIVGELTDEEKERLFNNVIGDKKSKWKQEEVQDFLGQLPSFPLDVSAAACYIKNVNITLPEYTNLLKTAAEDFLSLNEKFMLKYNNYNKTRYKIISSTLKNIIEQNNDFKEILLFIFMLDSQKIPTELLKAAYNSNTVNELLFYLEKYFLINSENNTISISRNAQQIGLHYLSRLVKCEDSLQKILKILTPYERIDKRYKNLSRFIPHLKAVSGHLNKLNLSDEKKADLRIKLFVTAGNIYRYKEQSVEESIDYFEEVLKLNRKYRYLNDYETAKIMLTAGDSCVLLGRNDSGEHYLIKSLAVLRTNRAYITDWADNLRLLGIIFTRRGKFDKANAYFDDAIKHMEACDRSDIAFKLAEARIYAAKSLNYLTHCINKKEMSDAVIFIKKAIDVLRTYRSKETIPLFEEYVIIREIAGLKIRLSGLENGIMNHDIALCLAEETEELLKKLPDEDNSSFCSYGMIFMEKAHAYLRMNDLQKAKEMFSKAIEICDKAPVDDYVWRVKMQQTETLIRLGCLEEAYKNCVYMFNIQNRKRNIAGDLFYNTYYYNAAVIQYRQGNIPKAVEHFRDFAVNMKEFCKSSLKKEDYDKLECANVFATTIQESEIKKYFANALKIFTAVCQKDSGFVRDYVEKNYLSIKE
jgi:DNA-binding CsgD family transcriptional regulator/tetratricopeptide (TPR) repeat protein